MAKLESSTYLPTRESEGEAVIDVNETPSLMLQTHHCRFISDLSKTSVGSAVSPINTMR